MNSIQHQGRQRSAGDAVDSDVETCRLEQITAGESRNPISTDDDPHDLSGNNDHAGHGDVVFEVRDALQFERSRDDSSFVNFGGS